MIVPALLDQLGPMPEGAGVHDVIRLREWGTDRVHHLPWSLADCVIGSSQDCALQLTAPGVRPEHALLTRQGSQWWIHSLGNDIGLRRDGAAVRDFVLEEGLEIGVGSTTLVAESARSIAKRAFCSRMLGWSCEPSVIDQALRSLHLARTRQAPLVLTGRGDLVGLAHSLHCRMFDASTPFVTCTSKLRRSTDLARYSASHASGDLAFSAAQGGTLCVRRSTLPRDLSRLLARLNEPQARVQLIVCLDMEDPGALLVGPPPMFVPPLHGRARELPAIVTEYAREAIAALRAPADCFTDEDLWWIVDRAATTLVEIERATLRIVALKNACSLKQAADVLRMKSVSLHRWFERRSQAPADYPGVAFARRPRVSLQGMAALLGLSVVPQ